MDEKLPCPWFHKDDKGSTWPVTRHLNNATHWNADHDQVRQEKVTKLRERGQPSIRQGFQGGRSGEATSRVVEFIVCTDQSLQLVENPVWRDLMNYLEPNLTLPETAQTLKQKILDHEVEVQKWMQDLLLASDECLGLWLSTDVGKLKLRGGAHFSTVSGHFIDSSFTARAIRLGMRRMEGGHTHKDLAKVLAEQLQARGVPVGIVAGMTSDTVAANCAAIDTAAVSIRLLSDADDDDFPDVTMLVEPQGYTADSDNELDNAVESIVVKQQHDLDDESTCASEMAHNPLEQSLLTSEGVLRLPTSSTS